MRRKLKGLMWYSNLRSSTLQPIGAFTRAPGPESGFKSGSQSTWERWSESAFESSLPPCKRNQSGSGSQSLC